MSAPKRRLFIMIIVSSVIPIHIGIFVNLYIWEKRPHLFEVSPCKSVHVHMFNPCKKPAGTCPLTGFSWSSLVGFTVGGYDK
jgi:hypothetical protein